MTRDELRQKIADVESLIDAKYQAALEQYHKYFAQCVREKKVVMRSQPERARFEHLAAAAIDRLKKEYAMQFTPAYVGDVIKTERCMMRVERIEVAAFEEPTLAFYGTYLKFDGTPYKRQFVNPILQTDIVRVVRSMPTNN